MDYEEKYLEEESFQRAIVNVLKELEAKRVFLKSRCDYHNGQLQILDELIAQAETEDSQETIWEADFN